MRMTGLAIENEENKELIFDDEVEKEINWFELCLVGYFLIEKKISIFVR